MRVSQAFLLEPLTPTTLLVAHSARAGSGLSTNVGAAGALWLAAGALGAAEPVEVALGEVAGRALAGALAVEAVGSPPQRGKARRDRSENARRW
jgi:hypothetical protein